MAANYVAIKVTAPSDSTAQLNELLKTDPHAGLNELVNLFESIKAGSKDYKVDVYVTDSDPSLSTGGGGSSKSYDMR